MRIILFVFLMLSTIVSGQDFDATKSLAEQGDAIAQFDLGNIYSTGLGVPENDAEAVKWYRLAAEQGLAAAQFNLGNMYRTGEGVPEDGVEAVKWFRLAADQGVSDAGANAQFNLGYMYFNGQGIPKDDAEAVKWFRLAAEQGLAVAQEYLGVMYVNGTGVPSNYLTSYFWLSIAMAQGVGAQTTLETVKNLLTAEQLSQGQAAISKCDDLSFKNCLEEEVRLVATEAARPNDYASLKAMAEQGNALAQYDLGVLLATGQGVPQNYVEAGNWFRIAAVQGNAKAQAFLGMMYDSGEGVPKIDAEAVKWHRLAAEQGITASQFYLGVKYANGEGVPQDLVLAYFWVLVASVQGFPEAKSSVEIIENALTNEQVARVQIAASSCGGLKFKNCLNEEGRLAAAETSRLQEEARLAAVEAAELKEEVRLAALKTEVLSVSDILLDFDDLLGESVTVNGVLLKMADLGFIYEERGSLVFINFDDSSANRDVRQTILKNCGSGCRATVSGVVENTVFGKSIRIQSIK